MLDVSDIDDNEPEDVEDDETDEDYAKRLQAQIKFVNDRIRQKLYDQVMDSFS
jgi:hypothetical protein